jgi:hypothetical protein
LSKYRSFGERQAMEVAWTMVWLRDFLCSPRELSVSTARSTCSRRSATAPGLLTSLRHRAGAGGATTPSSVTPFSNFFFVFFNL